MARARTHGIRTRMPGTRSGTSRPLKRSTTTTIGSVLRHGRGPMVSQEFLDLLERNKQRNQEEHAKFLSMNKETNDES